MLKFDAFGAKGWTNFWAVKRVILWDAHVDKFFENQRGLYRYFVKQSVPATFFLCRIEIGKIRRLFNFVSPIESWTQIVLIFVGNLFYIPRSNT